MPKWKRCSLHRFFPTGSISRLQLFSSILFLQRREAHRWPTTLLSTGRLWLWLFTFRRWWEWVCHCVFCRCASAAPFRRCQSVSTSRCLIRPAFRSSTWWITMNVLTGSSHAMIDDSKCVQKLISEFYTSEPSMVYVSFPRWNGHCIPGKINLKGGQPEKRDKYGNKAILPFTKFGSYSRFFSQLQYGFISSQFQVTAFKNVVMKLEYFLDKKGGA